MCPQERQGAPVGRTTSSHEVKHLITLCGCWTASSRSTDSRWTGVENDCVHNRNRGRHIHWVSFWCQFYVSLLMQKIHNPPLVPGTCTVHYLFHSHQHSSTIPTTFFYLLGLPYHHLIRITVHLTGGSFSSTSDSQPTTTKANRRLTSNSHSSAIFTRDSFCRPLFSPSPTLLFHPLLF